MCASCGCGMLNEDHGDDRHITLADLEQAAEAADITVEEVLGNLQGVVSQVGTTARPELQE
ncbi:MAG: hypothetical protein HYY03_00840 [Chloroflexi bacterium]|nr:hypothetical protein [Chloroflexota bacterium]